jgi:alcohol oxidase
MGRDSQWNTKLTISQQQRWAKYVDPVTGHRQDTSHRYLHPLLASGKPNIKVLYSTQVTRILLDSSHTAMGIECVPSHSDPFSSSTPPPVKTILAKKLVIASCGSIATPGLLERSGIGRKEVLEKAGIEQLVDLPGVGENYQDHNLIVNTYEVEEKVDTHDAFFLKTSSILSSAESDFKQGKGKYATNFVDFAGKIRPTEEAVSKMGAFKQQWESYYKNKPDKPVVLQAIINCLFGDHSKFPQGMKFISYGNYTAYAVSRGSVHVTGKNVYEAPRFDSGYLSAPEDLPTLVWGYKQGREVCRRMRCIVGEIPELNPPFDLQSKAAAQRHFERGEGWDVDKVQNIEYSEEDEKVIEEWIRENVRTAWHPLGTCAMRAREQGGVVDKDLRVYGTSNLMVADMSICPENVGANTNNTALLVGEKAATLAARFLGVEID